MVESALASESVRPFVVEVRGLSRRYGSREVLCDVSFELREGEILGILGPNGAGKTTLLETLEGLRRVERGAVMVLGFDVTRQARTLQPLLGIQLQRTSLMRNLTVGETLRLYKALYRCARADQELLARVELEGAHDTLVQHLSGGQFQRFSLCLATLHSPRLLFLDEPTTGLDPHARRRVWDLVAAARDQGASVVLTTHYMEEAHVLCDRVAILNAGRLLALGTPSELIGGLDAQTTVQVETAVETDEPALRAALAGIADLALRGTQVRLFTRDVPAALRALFRHADERSLELRNLNVRSADLEDLFVHLTRSTTPELSA